MGERDAAQRRHEQLEQWRRELDGYKREINLVEYAISCGYELRKRESYRSARVLKHTSDNHKIVVARDATDSHWVYFAIQPGGYEGAVSNLRPSRFQIIHTAGDAHAPRTEEGTNPCFYAENEQLRWRPSAGLWIESLTCGSRFPI